MSDGCAHENFDAQIIVNRLADTGLFNADVKIWCADCAQPFEFPESLPIGIDLRGITRSVDAQMLRIAVQPATQPDPWEATR